MSAASELTRKRWGGGGLLLAILLSLLLVAPLLRHRGMDHPLVASQQLDLCQRLPAPPASLADLRAEPVVDRESSSCQFVGKDGRFALVVSLSSTRSLSAPGAPADTEKMFETWMKEVRANYGNGDEVAGPWRHGFAWKARQESWLLFEDGGVLVLVHSERLDPDRIRDYAQAVQQSLRADRDD